MSPLIARPYDTRQPARGLLRTVTFLSGAGLFAAAAARCLPEHTFSATTGLGDSVGSERSRWRFRTGGAYRSKKR